MSLSSRDWKSILADALRRGLRNQDVAREQGATSGAVTDACRRHGVVLTGRREAKEARYTLIREAYADNILTYAEIKAKFDIGTGTLFSATHGVARVNRTTFERNKIRGELGLHLLFGREELQVVSDICLYCSAPLNGRLVRYCSSKCSLEAIRKPPREADAGFLDERSVRVVSGCIEWTGRRQRFGYGQVKVGKKNYLAHRLSYQVHIGPIPDGMCVCHRCDNPPCINPAHFFLGTLADNNRDRMEKGRGRCPRGELHPNAKLTDATVRLIRASAERHTVLARRFGVSGQVIHAARKRKTWKHLA